jgi:uncharacterized membrane protein
LGIGSTEVLLLPFLFSLPLVMRYAVIEMTVGGPIRDASMKDDDTSDGTAREILDRCYARAEIGRDEYRRSIRDLQAG